MRRMDASGYATCFDHQQLALMCANSDRTIDGLGAENKQLKAENAKLRKLVSDMGKMLTLASWASVENDEQASQCIYRAEALGIEVD